MKAVFFLVVFGAVSHTAVSQVCFLGGGGSGAATKEILYCSDVARFTSSQYGSGFGIASLLSCSDIARFTSSEKGSGFDSCAISYCHIQNNDFQYHSSNNGFSGFYQNGIRYCDNNHFEGGESNVAFNYSYYCSTVSFNGSTGSGNSYAQNFCLNPLPIELMEFYALKNKEHALLLWKTGTEINNAFFSIEKAFDGLTFNEIGTIPGAGNSNYPINYHFVDSNPINGINYYRLRSIDYDGNFETSKMVALDFTETESLNSIFIYPNPISAGEAIHMILPGNEKICLEIYYISGTLMQREESIISPESGIYSLTLNQYNPGIYMLVINGESFHNESKFIIQ